MCSTYEAAAMAKRHADELEAVLVAEASGRPVPHSEQSPAPAVPIPTGETAQGWQPITELRAWLDTVAITSDNIGDIRRSLFFPWDSKWNAAVRDETAERENRPLPPPPSGAAASETGS